MSNYHELAMRTAAGPEVFHYPHNVPEPTEDDIMESKALDINFLADVIKYLNAAAQIDRWKSRLFYGKDKIVIENAVSPHIGASWSLNNIANPQMIHAILGIATEGAELMEDLVKMAGSLTYFSEDGLYTYPEEYSDNMSREQGDVDWYQELLAKVLNEPIEESRRKNIERLQKRYPDKFSEQDAIERKDEKHDQLAARPSKQSSPDLSSLASKILRLTPLEITKMETAMGVQAYEALLADAKRLAGSVLSQDETPGQR